MQNRVRLLMGASALLYMGPLLAGLSGMGWAALPVFMALFALWLVVMRPAQWPRDRPGGMFAAPGLRQRPRARLKTGHDPVRNALVNICFHCLSPSLLRGLRMHPC